MAAPAARVGKGGKGKKGAGTGKGEKDPNGDSKHAGSGQPESACASDPVDVVTGRVFTFPVNDLELAGPLPLALERAYSSAAAGRDVGLGFGWSHTYGWEVEASAKRVRVWTDEGLPVDVRRPAVGSEVLGPLGWRLRAEHWGYALDAGDGLWRLFSASDRRKKRFRLTAVEDRNRNRIALTYDDATLALLEIEDSAGRRVLVERDPAGRIRSLAVVTAQPAFHSGPLASYAYDDAGNLVRATDADGHSATFAYDASHRITLERDRTGLTFHFTYDAAGRCVEAYGDYEGRPDPSLARDLPRVLADGVTRVKGISHCRFAWYGDAYSEVVDSTQVRRFDGTDRGTIERAVGGGGVLSVVYDRRGHLASTTDAIGSHVEYERDARGRVVRFTNPLGHTVVIDRNEHGLPARVVDGEGHATVLTYDAAGNVIAEADALDAVTTYERDARGLITAVIEPNGAMTRFAYDAHGNCVAMEQPNGGRWRWSYDPLGRKTSATDPLGATTRFRWSARGDLLATENPLGATRVWVYDGERHVVRETDANGLTRELVWGGYHRICGWTDSAGDAVTCSYDLEGALLEVRDRAGRAHRYVYDPSGRLIEEHTMDGRTVRYRHDAVCRVVSIENAAGQRTLQTWDAAWQLIARERGDEREEFEYDRCGRLVRAKSSIGQWSFERDPVGRVVREVQEVGGLAVTVDVTLDAMGRFLQRRSSLASIDTVARDAMGGRVTTLVGEGRAKLEHASDLLGREARIRLAAGGVVDHAYDQNGHLLRRTAHRPNAGSRSTPEPEWVGAPRGDVTADVAWTRDLLGDVVVESDLQRGQTRYRYDPIGRLLESKPDHGRHEVFSWDDAGNLHDLSPDVPRQTFDANKRIVARGPTEYRWDAANRLGERVDPHLAEDPGGWRFEWSASGYLDAAERSDGLSVRFAYDPFGRRMTKSVRKPDGEREDVRYVWEQDLMVQEARLVDGAPVLARTYCYSDVPFEPLAHADHGSIVNERVFYYLTDEVGSPRKLLDGHAAIAGDLEQVSAWGAMRPSASDTAVTPLRLPGQYADEETSLSYNRFRYYDPSDGRFVSPDPIELEGAPIRSATSRTRSSTSTRSPGTGTIGCAATGRTDREPGTCITTGARATINRLPTSCIDTRTAPRFPAAGWALAIAWNRSPRAAPVVAPCAASRTRASPAGGPAARARCGPATILVATGVAA